MIGSIWANLFDALIDGIALGVLVYVKEAPGFVPTKPGDAVRRICQCFQETGRFLLTNLQAEKIMLMNAFAGAIAILLEFFLQSALIEAGMIRSMLGPALFAVSMGGALGAKLSAGLGNIRYAHLACISTLGVTGAMAMGLSGAPLLMTVGGFLALMLDDALQVRTDALLNDMFPSSQRATLISVSSLCFSMIMIILSPVVGWMFGHL